MTKPIETPWWAGMTLRQAQRQFRSSLVDWALALHDGNCTKAAKALGIHRNILARIRDEAGNTKMRSGRKPSYGRAA